MRLATGRFSDAIADLTEALQHSAPGWAGRALAQQLLDSARAH